MLARCLVPNHTPLSANLLKRSSRLWSPHTLNGRRQLSKILDGQSSSKALVPSLVKSVATKQPCFGLQSNGIRILNHPKEFYGQLLSMIKGAKHKLSISSLYIGNKETELLNALQDALAKTPTLTLDLHIDYLRSTRPEAMSTAEFLIPLLHNFPERVNVYMYRNPKLKGLMEKLVPRRFDEGWGTWHAKIYAADDEVIISGANLNTSYFTDRQDRYIHFTNQPVFTQYLRDFLGQFRPYCHRLLPVGENGYHMEWWNDTAGPTSFEADAKESLMRLQDRHRRLSTPPMESLSADEGACNDTVIFPMIQAGTLGIREEEWTIGTLFHHLDQAKAPITVDLTSGYFGLHQQYRERVIAAPSHINWRVVAASPKANGFYGSKGLSGRIPEAYTWLEKMFWESALQNGKISGDNGRVELSEWEREGWTYHAKGIWVRFGEDTAQGCWPFISLFGSTNLNSRSANLDTELSFLMVTRSSILAKALSNEVEGIREHAAEVGGETWAAKTRRVRYSTMGMAKVVSGML